MTEAASQLLSRPSSPSSSLQEIMGTIRLPALLFAPYFAQSFASRSAEKHLRIFTLAEICRIPLAGIVFARTAGRATHPTAFTD